MSARRGWSDGRRWAARRVALFGRLAALTALAAVAVVALAPPASAHALLLSSDPAAGAIVARAPSSIQLHFSENVSVPFGAMRLTDPAGRPVTTGALRGGGSGRDLVMDLPALDRGSYDLAWQVLASDGHPSRGDFIFSVGAPSGGAPRAARVAAKSALVGPLTGLSRFAWMMAFMFLVGATLLRRFVWNPAMRAAGALESPINEAFRRRFCQAARAGWIVLVAAGAVGLVTEAASVSPGPFWSALQPWLLARLLATTYGHLWLVQMTLAAAMALPVYALTGPAWRRGPSNRSWLRVGTVVAGGLAATMALSGHGATRPVLTTAFVGLHLLASAVWVGGLGALVVVAGPAWRRLPETPQAWKLKPVLLRQLLGRFSRLALVSVPVLVVSGLVAAAGGLGHPANLWRVAYGQVILIKVVLLSAALGFGAWHFFVIPRRLAGPNERVAVVAFERTSAAEALLLVAAIGAAAVLVGLVPGRNLDLTGRAAVDQSQPVGTYSTELFIARPALGPNQIHVSFTTGNGLLAGEISGVTSSLRGPDGLDKPVDLRLDTPGHFSGVGIFPRPGPYHLAVSDTNGASTIFGFQVADLQATG